LKFIGKETQRKIDLQIQTLQERIVALENQLNISKNEMSAATKKLQQEKLDLEKSKNQELNAFLENAKAEKVAALQEAAKESEQKIGKLQSQLDSAQADVTKLLATVEAAEAKNNSLASQLAQANASIAEGQPKLAEALAKITYLDAQLTDATTKLNNQTKELDKAKSELVEQLKKVEASNIAIAATENSLQAANVQVSTLQAASEDSNKKLQDLSAQLDKKSDEASALSKKLKQLENDLSAANTAKAESEKATQSLKSERDIQTKLAQQTEAKYQDSAQENELLLLQLMQAQEELVEYYEQKGEFEKLYLAYKARWDRLEKRFPNYLDYGVIEVEQVDGLSDVPSVTWKVKDFAQAGVALSEFSFQTTLQAGHPGIGLIQDGTPKNFVPKLLAADKAQLATFMGVGATEFKQINAAISILNQLEAGQWKGFEAPAQFDLGFWRPSLKALIGQVQSLPAVLRYDQVKLKRELINPDYEHLWLEFHGLHLGAQNWKKFEIPL
jgi:chromosome segregation ATPase